MRVLRGCALVPILCCSLLFSDAKSAKLPSEVSSALGRTLSRYLVEDTFHPPFLNGDFDGDRKPDYAVKVKQAGTNNRGFAVYLSSESRTFVLGAGNPVFYGAARERDLNFDSWEATKMDSVEMGVGESSPPQSLKSADGILVSEDESASGIYYWNGKTWLWYQQGD